MESTLADSNMIIIVNKFLYKLRGIRRGDIIVARSMGNPAMDICKRVMLLEGEMKKRIKFPRITYDRRR